MSERTQGPPVQFRSMEVEPQLDLRLSHAAGSPGRVAARDLDRYYALLAAELRRVDLSESEAMLLIDALNGVLHDAPESIPTMLWAGVDDAIRLDGLDATWGVDGAAVVAKLRALTPTQATAVVDAVERWWLIAGAADEAGGGIPAEREARLRVVGLVR